MHQVTLMHINSKKKNQSKIFQKKKNKKKIAFLTPL